MRKTFRKIAYSWGNMLAVIPFIVLLIYGAYSVSTAARGAVANSVNFWIFSEMVLAVISALVFGGLAILVARPLKKGSKEEGV